MVWSELDRVVQNKIAYRYSTGENVGKLADEFGLNTSSLIRKIRKLREIKIYDKMVMLGSGISTVPEPSIVKTSTDQSRIENGNLLELLVNRSNKTIKSNNSDITFHDAKRINDRVIYLDSNKEWSILYFTDWHCPLQDNSAIDAMIRVIKTVDHNLLINGGDNLDLYGLSSFVKDNDYLFKNNFNKEIAAHDIIMEKVANASNAPKLSLYGNHLDRYDKWLSNTPFIDLDRNTNIGLDSVLKMFYYGWNPFVGTIMVSDKKDLQYPKPTIIFDHGQKATKGAGNSALSQFKDYGAVSYVMGHVHRLSVAYKRTLHGQHCIAEGGTLRDLNPDYTKYPDWQNGMLHISVNKDVVTATPILFSSGKALIAGIKI